MRRCIRPPFTLVPCIFCQAGIRARSVFLQPQRTFWPIRRHVGVGFEIRYSLFWVACLQCIWQCEPLQVSLLLQLLTSSCRPVVGCRHPWNHEWDDGDRSVEMVRLMAAYSSMLVDYPHRPMQALLHRRRANNFHRFLGHVSPIFRLLTYYHFTQ